MIQRGGDTNRLGTVYDLMNACALARVSVRDLDRPEGLVRAGSMIKKRTERGEVPRQRTLFRVLTLGAIALAVLAVPAASGATTFHHALGAHTIQVTTDASRLQAGEILLDGSALVSASGRYRLALQSDGNLVLYWESNPIWNSGTRGDAPDHLIMQNDGNLVLYQGLQVLWSSKTGGGVRSNGYYLSLQNDGDAIIYSPANKPVWTTNTAVQPGLQFGDSGSSVRRLQERLSELGYWLGPPNGVFGDSTQQAVYALQKAADLSRDGVVGTRTVFALASGVVPKPRRRPRHDHPGGQARLHAQHLYRRWLHLHRQDRDVCCNHAKGRVPYFRGDQRPRRRLARHAVAAEVLHRSRDRAPR